MHAIRTYRKGIVDNLKCESLVPYNILKKLNNAIRANICFFSILQPQDCCCHDVMLKKHKFYAKKHPY